MNVKEKEAKPKMNEQCPVCDSPITDQDSICPACGFKLLGSTQRFQPVSVSADELVPHKEIPAKAALLRVVRGPQIEMTFTLGEDYYVIGRSPQCDIFLNDMTVSREHARIARMDTGYRICDNNSFNGVWINNESIDEALLHEGDIVQIGAFCLLYEENQQG